MVSEQHSLQALPVELKIKVLKFLPQISTLSNLVHASAAYYRVYTADREAIFTSVTIRELESRDIDIFKPTPFANVLVRKDKLNSLILPTVISAREQYHKGKGDPKLSIDQCILLLKIIEWRAGQIKIGSDGHRQASWEREQPRDFRPSRPGYELSTLNLGPYSSDEVKKMRQEAEVKRFFG